MVKRMVDVGLAAFALLLFAPMLVLLAIAVRLDSRGSAFYGGQRAGRFGRPFRMWKFRTMIADAEKLGGPSTAEGDPRITRAGRVLRKYKLDELPQLWNVLRGEMSLVGPRPEVLSEVRFYSEKERQILNVRPGLTDWASLRFANEGAILKGSPHPHQAYREKIRPEKIRLGLEYARRNSIPEDFRIVLMTVKRICTATRHE